MWEEKEGKLRKGKVQRREEGHRERMGVVRRGKGNILGRSMVGKRERGGSGVGRGKGAEREGEE